MHLPSMRFLIGTFLSASALLSMEPPDRGMIDTFRKDGTLSQRIAFAKSLGNHKVSNGLTQYGRYKLMKAAMDKKLIANRVLPTPPDAWKDMPTTGNVKILTILIDFSDYQHNDAKNSLAQVTDRIFGDGDGEVAAPYESFKAFYERSSYGKLHLDGSVLGWYRPSYTRASMAETTPGREQLIKEALQSFDAGTDFSEFDNNGDGVIDFFSVVWTGPDNGWSGFWWGYQTSFGDDTFKLDGVGFKKYSWQWESRYRDAENNLHYDGPFSPDTLIHEQGHGLGLPDYYDYDDAVGPRGGIGGFDMMDWADDHNCFSKWLLDWITPDIVDTSVAVGTKTLRSAADHEDALIVMPGAMALSADMTKPFGEFFMLQNRQRTGNDADLTFPGSGLVIWHVDSRLDADGYDYLYDNSYTEHKLLRLMEADGLEQIETDAAGVDAGDFYVSGKELGPTTTPSTARYSGVYTYFGINNISASGPSMTFNIYTQAPDTTAPSGKPTQPLGSVSLDEVTFTWAKGTATDSNGLIVGYNLQVGTTAGGSDVFNGDVGNVLTRTLKDLGTWDGKPLFARVKAMNSSGLFTGWSDISDAVTVNLAVYAGCSDLDNCNLTFKHVGTWESDAVDFHTGTTSAHGSAEEVNGTTTLQTSVAGPGILTFWWAASTEKDYDFYSYRIDGVTQSRVSGDVDWAKKTVAIPAGSHVISWRWIRDSGGGGTKDLVWLDDVQFNSQDLNQDGVWDILDLGELAWAHGSDSVDSNWISEADLDGDDDVDNDDIALFRSAAGF